MLTHQTGSQLADLLARREITSVRLTEQFLDAIGRHDPKLRAFLHVDEAGALEKARASDERRLSGAPVGLLEGLPDKEIAERLGISRYTVNQYTKAIYASFGVHSRAALLARQLQVGGRRKQRPSTP